MTITPLVVTNRQEFYNKCKSAFHLYGVEVQICAHQALEVKAVLHKLHCDFILVDVSVEEHTAKMLENLRQTVVQTPALFLVLPQRTPNWEKYFLKAGAMYVFDQSMDEATVTDCVLHLYSFYRWVERGDEMLPELVGLLRGCCISSHQRGYACIFDSVRLIYYQPDHMQSLTKKVYPYVAQLHETTALRVEKNIRDAVRNAWERGGSSTMPAILGCDSSHPPSNGQLIAAICEKLRENIYRKSATDKLPSLY